MFNHFPGIEWPTPYGLTLALAGGAAWWFARRRAWASGLNPAHVDLALPLAVACGICAARLLARVIPKEHLIAGDALLVDDRFRLPALAMGGLLCLFAYCRVSGISMRRMSDAIAPAALLAIAMLRIGCLLAGCCFGDIVGNAPQLAALEEAQLRLQVQTLPALSPDALPWKVSFPPGSPAYRQHEALGLIEHGADASLAIHPVQLYETVATLLACCALLWLQARPHRPGTLAVSALAAYASIALALQFLRADSALLVGPLTANQLIYLMWLAAVPLLAGVVRARGVPEWKPARAGR